MKTCPNQKCKASGLPDDAKFCPNCGEQIVQRNEFLNNEKENSGNRKTQNQETSPESFIGALLLSAIIPGFNVIMLLISLASDKQSNKADWIPVMLGIIIDVLVFFTIIILTK